MFRSPFLLWIAYANAYQNALFANFGASPNALNRMKRIHPNCRVYETPIKDSTTVWGWQTKWDEYYAASEKGTSKMNTLHCISGGLINAMIYLDANKGVRFDRIVLESPVWANADMMIKFDHGYNKLQMVSKTLFLSRWRRDVDGSHHYFTDKLLKPFDESKLDEVRYVINELLIERSDEIIIITCENDRLNNRDHVSLLMQAAQRKGRKCAHYNVRAKHACFSIMKTDEFETLLVDKY